MEAASKIALKTMKIRMEFASKIKVNPRKNFLFGV